MTWILQKNIEVASIDMTFLHSSAFTVGFITCLWEMPASHWYISPLLISLVMLGKRHVIWCHCMWYLSYPLKVTSREILNVMMSCNLFLRMQRENGSAHTSHPMIRRPSRVLPCHTFTHLVKWGPSLKLKHTFVISVSASLHASTVTFPAGTWNNNQ